MCYRKQIIKKSRTPSRKGKKKRKKKGNFFFFLGSTRKGKKKKRKKIFLGQIHNMCSQRVIPIPLLRIIILVVKLNFQPLNL